MKQMITCLLGSLCLVACSTSPHPVSMQGVETLHMTTSIHSDDAFASLALPDDIITCPRFSSSLDAAEKILGATPKNYVHIL